MAGFKAASVLKRPSLMTDNDPNSCKDIRL